MFLAPIFQRRKPPCNGSLMVMNVRLDFLALHSKSSLGPGQEGTGVLHLHILISMEQARSFVLLNSVTLLTY